MNPRYITAGGILGRLCSSIAAGVPPRCFTATPGLEDVIPLRPGELSILGGAPGSGKTLLAFTLVIDALRANPGLRALIGNCEMPPERLLARQLARLSGVPLSRIENHEPGITDSPQFGAAVATLESIADRLAFLSPPFTAATLEAAGMKFEPELVLVDYVQRFTAGPETGGRENIDGMVSFLRQLCTEAGCAVLAIAAVHRGKDSRGGSTYGGGIGLASFRGSSELEFGADSAFTLQTNKRGKAVLACCKSRYGAMESARLVFDFPRASFAIASSGDEAVLDDAAERFGDELDEAEGGLDDE
jgi:replicative DNA helicase